MDFQQLQRDLLLNHWRHARTLGQPRGACGPGNRISDVAGVRVGHYTLNDGERQTGVTAIVPPGDNVFLTPLPCGAEVLNGFAKPVGLVQVEELGVLQTPILLSNTLAVGTLFTTLVRDAIRRNPELGRTLPTVNPLALECNDGWLNDIQSLSISEAMAQAALRTPPPPPPQRDAGSVIIVMATDAPLDARQLKRIARRAGAGLGRLGSYWGHGSGDIAVAFSTQPLPQPPQDDQLEPLLAAAADATEQAVLDALLSAEAVTGFRGHHRPSLTQILDKLTA
ncbi:P1 family peptidase [Pantoea ananatis]|uniref:P1 family peptidase n=1 Tax=Pantoea ananas TaxID=553 RepID=UPI000497CC63|nr:P1 family peptidase [Pantoea ananatis]